MLVVVGLMIVVLSTCLTEAEPLHILALGSIGLVLMIVGACRLNRKHPRKYLEERSEPIEYRNCTKERTGRAGAKAAKGRQRDQRAG